MSTLIANRFLFPEFTGRNVVFRSGATVSLSSNINVRATVDFGKHGSVDVSANLDCEKFDPHMVYQMLSKHGDEVLSIIDGLESFLAWARKPTTETFSHFCDNEDPIYVYGSKKKGNGKTTMIMELFGRKLNGLDIRGADLVKQVNAIIGAFQQHLKDLETIKMQDLIEVCANKARAWDKAKSRTA